MLCLLVISFKDKSCFISFLEPHKSNVDNYAKQLCKSQKKE